MTEQSVTEYKGYRIVGLQSGLGASMVAIKAKGQGQIPAKLSGYWTTPSIAKTGIDSYLSSVSKSKGRPKNAKTTSTPADNAVQEGAEH